MPRWTKADWLRLCLWLVLLSCPGLDLAAQADSVARATDAQTDRMLLRGRVIDESTRAPLEGAIVMRIGSLTGYVTDSLGLWVLEVDPSRIGYPLSVEQLGYAALEVTLSPSATDEFTTVKLKPNPLALEGLQVVVDRFEHRRRFYFGPVRVVDQARLRRAAGTAYDVLRTEVPFARPCTGDPTALCAIRRGRRMRVEICIDEVPAWGGATDLEAYDPAELYLVEVYNRGEQVRVYTRWFVERAVRQGKGLQPLAWGCA